MPESIYLMGSEKVESAGHRIDNAANGMCRAVGHLEDSLLRHRQFMDDWLVRLETVLRDHRNARP